MVVELINICDVRLLAMISGELIVGLRVISHLVVCISEYGVGNKFISSTLVIGFIKMGEGHRYFCVSGSLSCSKASSPFCTLTGEDKCFLQCNGEVSKLVQVQQDCLRGWIM